MHNANVKKKRKIICMIEKTHNHYTYKNKISDPKKKIIAC
jgi:hypothetical protein